MRDRSPSFLFDVCAMSASRAYAVGTSGAVLEWRNNDWWPMRAPMQGNFSQVVCLPETGHLIVGLQGGGVIAMRVPAEN